MITAVFMFALEMGRSSVDIPKNQQIQEVEMTSKAKSDSIEQIITLKLEIQRLNKMLAQKKLQDVNPGGLEKTYDATSSEPKPLQGLDQTHASDFEIVVRFKDEAIALTADERARLLESLQPVVTKGKSNIYVEVPAGFSEAKRMGFYRAMAVRNLLIEMNVPKENIDVSVVEGKGDANSSLVMVR
jgi:hypothetical protein